VNVQHEVNILLYTSSQLKVRARHPLFFNIKRGFKTKVLEMKFPFFLVNKEKRNEQFGK
jgi:hypothetical protein